MCFVLLFSISFDVRSIISLMEARILFSLIFGTRRGVCSGCGLLASVRPLKWELIVQCSHRGLECSVPAY